MTYPIFCALESRNQYETRYEYFPVYFITWIIKHIRQNNWLRWCAEEIFKNGSTEKLENLEVRRFSLATAVWFSFEAFDRLSH